MKEIINEMKNINIVDQIITIKWKNIKELELLAEKLIGKEVK